MKVLIIDDNRQMRRLLSEVLETVCDSIFECSDGSQALSLYAQTYPDWVLMDWKMPETDGITATRQIIGDYPAANICMVTSFDDPVLKEEALAAGAKYFVLKRNLTGIEKILLNKK